MYYRGERIGFHEIAKPIPEGVEAQLSAARMRVRRTAKPDHSWRLNYEMRLGSRAPLAASPVVLHASASP